MKKLFITAQDLLQDSFQLAMTIYQSGYQPDFIVGVWRGGAPIGIAVQEMMHFLGVEADHIAIRTSSYSGINKREKDVRVHGLQYLVERLQANHQLLIVDDVFDTGLSIKKVIEELENRCGAKTPEIRVATLWFKPENNKTTMKPDFYLHESGEWLVFPHELMGLDLEEACDNKPELKAFRQQLEKLVKKPS